MSNDPSTPRSTTERPVHDTHIDRTTTTTTKSGSSMAIIVAAVILVLAALAYFVFNGSDVVETAPAVGTENVAPVSDAPVVAPAADPATGIDTTVAPADDTPAPADSTDETAPAAIE